MRGVGRRGACNWPPGLLGPHRPRLASHNPVTQAFILVASETCLTTYLRRRDGGELTPRAAVNSGTQRPEVSRRQPGEASSLGPRRPHTSVVRQNRRWRERTRARPGKTSSPRACAPLQGQQSESKETTWKSNPELLCARETPLKCIQACFS